MMLSFSPFINNKVLNKVNMQNVKDISPRQLVPGIMAKLVHGDKCSLSIVDIAKGTTMNVHQHMHEQITYILEGQMEMEIGGEKMSMPAGTVHVIPPNTPHSAYAITDVKVIDIFSPVREEYK